MVSERWPDKVCFEGDEGTVEGQQMVHLISGKDERPHLWESNGFDEVAC